MSGPDPTEPGRHPGRRRVAVTLAEASTSLGADLTSTFAALAAGATGFARVEGVDVSTAVNDRAAVRSPVRSTARLLSDLVRRVSAARGALRVDRAYFAGTPDDPPPAVPALVVRPPAAGRVEGGWDRVYTGACVSSSSALVDAAGAIAHGWCDRVVVVAARGLDPETFSVFSAGGAMTREPVMHPLSTGAAGVLLGEGAAILLLEAEDVAAAGSALAEVRGWARTGDAFHPFQPDPAGAGMARALRAAVRDAGLSAAQIDLVSVHGTATELNDRSEVAALTEVFGPAGVPALHAPKGALGHTLEAAGLVESAVAVRSLTAGVVPPTAGLTGHEPLLAGLADEAADREVTHVAKMNLAFGGCNTALVLSRWAPGRPAAVPAGTAVTDGTAVPGPPRLRRRAVVGSRPDAPRLPGFLKSGFPAAVADAAERALTAADLSAPERAGTAIIILSGRGDTETRAAVRACLDAGRRPPPPLFVQSTPSSIGGLVARRWQLGGGVNVMATTAGLDAPAVLAQAAETVAIDGARAVLLVRHLPPGDGEPSRAEAAVHSL